MGKGRKDGRVKGGVTPCYSASGHDRARTHFFCWDTFWGEVGERVLMGEGGKGRARRSKWGKQRVDVSLSVPTIILPLWGSMTTLQSGPDRSPVPRASQAELLIRCCTDIVRSLLLAHEANESINLNALKTSIAKKHQCGMVPRLVDIIAAVPQEAREILLPKLRAKPVRTASGVS